MVWRRGNALALLAFGVAGVAGLWSALPAAVLLVALAWLPGAVALAPCVEGCARDGVRCPISGPGGVASAVAFSLVALVPALLPLFVLGLDLESARISLGSLYVVLGAGALALGSRASSSGESTRDLWLAAAAAVAVLMPLVLRYAGGAVDDWWDLAFIRAHVDAPALGFAEPFLATGSVHPRFSWSSWRVLQALVLEFSAADAIGFQARELAAFVCISGACATAGLARALFGTRPAAVLSVLALPLWLYGTEPMPYFVRLHQDKFVAALVLMPALLAVVLHHVARPTPRSLVLVGVCALALSAVHGVVTAVAVVGAIVCALSSVGTRGDARGPIRALAPLAAALAPALLFPAWQALAVRGRFAAQGIGLEHPDNPVVRAHLALGRLLWPDAVFAMVNPAAVMGPVGLVAAVGLIVAIVHRRERAPRILIGLTAVPAVLAFLPPVAALTGRVLVPWMLYRVAWLIPVPFLLGYLFAAVGRLVKEQPARGAAVALVTALSTVVAVVPTTRDRIARQMREHPDAPPRSPHGTALELYRALDALPAPGTVLAPPGASNLVPALAGRSVVAFSERGTVVFSEREADAYRRLRDRAAFLAESTAPHERARIAADNGVAYAVLAKRSVAVRDEDAKLARASGDGFVLARADGWRLWPADAGRRARALPGGWPVVFENDDYVVVRAAAGTSPQRPSPPGPSIPSAVGHGSWHRLLGAQAPRPTTPTPRAEVLASAAGFPGARIELAPVPAALGTTNHLVWTAGRALWDDGPAEVVVTLAMATECLVTAVEVVPFLQTGRREVLEVGVGGRTVRRVARDARPLRLELDRGNKREVVVRVGSMLGVAFGLADVRLLGDRGSCVGGWQPLDRPELPRADDRAVLALALSRPDDADAAIEWARRRTAAGGAGDALAVLRRSVAHDPTSARAWVELGLAEDAAGRSGAALAAFGRALRVDSNSAWAHGCMAWARLRSGDVLAALRHAAGAATRDPRYADAYTILAKALQAVGLRGFARRNLSRSMELDPRRSWAYLELARMMLEDGQRAEAVEMLEVFLERVPDDAGARAMLSRAG